MQKVYIRILLIMLITIFFGCKSFYQNSELDKMSNKEIETYFFKNKDKLKEVVDICEKYPPIKRIEKDSVLYYDNNISRKIKQQSKIVQSIVKKLKIDSIQCSRSEMVLNNQLMGVSFVLYSGGLGISGEGQSIDYDTEKFRILLSKKKKVNIPWETLSPLPEKGWTISYTKS